MPNYTVRVVLHNVKDDSEKYTELHGQMSNQGFSRRISIDGKSWQLPPAEYSKVSDDASAVVLAAAKKAALAVMGRENAFSVLVTRGDSPRVFHNLEVAK
ncbi:hypothetical protein [Cupriavidus oxalaticus]|uniref:hypothetical protein n=1 Tax=Cupriavidus oxalaticus TaxID=96344 RepID=UPI004033E013